MMTPCNAVHWTMGACTLEYGHPGEHVYAHPENKDERRSGAGGRPHQERREDLRESLRAADRLERFLSDRTRARDREGRLISGPES